MQFGVDLFTEVSGFVRCRMEYAIKKGVEVVWTIFPRSYFSWKEFMTMDMQTEGSLPA